MREIELIEKRKLREKHFLQEDGTIVAKIYDENVHYIKDGKYEEIDNSLIEKDEYFVNNKNEYKVKFNKRPEKSVMKMEFDGHFLDIKLMNNNNPLIKIINKKSYNHEKVLYNDILENIDLEYKVLPTKVKESIIIKSKKNIYSRLEFIIDTDMDLILNSDKSISVINKNNFCFKFDAPFMFDSSGKENNNIFYELNKVGNYYKLCLILDNIWLNRDDIVYPIVIDPTITNYSEDNNVFDTYIYPNDTNVDRNSKNILKAGVERVNGIDVINRTLLKFNLPTIGTGSKIVDARVRLIGYTRDYNSDYEEVKTEIRRITSDWNETTANWNNMYNNYDHSRVDGSMYSLRSNNYDGLITSPAYNYADITDLVNRWYTDLPNYGIMIKSYDETYKNNNYPAFFSKNNSFNDFNPKPILQITYRNQNGLENYMQYIKQPLLNGEIFVNIYNGNITNKFNVGSTGTNHLSYLLDLFYNTNDVILDKNYGCGKGWKFGIYQTVKKVEIDNTIYLEYLDEDGTLHYFRDNKFIYDENGNTSTITSTNTYYDEDGLNFRIIENNDNFILYDKNNNYTKFNKINDVGYLAEIKDTNGRIITVNYDSLNRPIRIIDACGMQINITYLSNSVTIVTPIETIILNLQNNRLVSIVSMLGTVLFNYDLNNIITSIQDINSMRFVFDYYTQVPYKLYKLYEYSSDNSVGNTLTFNYKFSSTTIIDNNGKTATFTFNKFGNVASITNLESHDSLKNAYGREIEYGEAYQDKNMIISSGRMIKYVKNYLSNSSFEESEFGFETNGNGLLSITDTKSRSGNNSLKFQTFSNDSFLKREIVIDKGKYYTFSSYISNNVPVRISLSYKDNENNFVQEYGEYVVDSDDFYRHDVTIFYPNTATSNLILKIYIYDAGVVYIDDVQLEDGEVVNNYNYIENSDFSSGLSQWTLSGSTNQYEIVTLLDMVKALKIKMNLGNDTMISRKINISGSEGDIYTLSFWYKNEGLNTDAKDSGETIYNNTSVFFDYTNGIGSGTPLGVPLNVNCDEWQFYTFQFKANSDYTGINIRLFQIMNANDLYITNLCLYKDERKISNKLDQNSNLVNIAGLDNQVNTFKYDINNKLVKATAPSGENMYLEYDNNNSKLLLGVISHEGISTRKKYDSFGNEVINRINYVEHAQKDLDYYKIRAKGTNKYLDIIHLKLSDSCYLNYVCNLIGTENGFKIKDPIITNSILTSYDDSSIVLASSNNNNLIFKLKSKDNGSYLLKVYDKELYLKTENDSIKLGALIENDPSYEFFFEVCNYPYFIENNTNYSSDGRFPISYTDSLLGVSYNTYDAVSGLLLSKTNAKGNVKTYEYNSKYQLISSGQNDRLVNITYNDNLIENIIYGSKIYKLEYDEFSKIKCGKIGNNTLYTNNYENNNGKLLSTVYGNNDVVAYEYDELDRLKRYSKEDCIYNYKYNNYGKLSKVVSSKYKDSYYYDPAERVSKYVNCSNNNDEFYIYYNYNKDGQILEKKYRLNNIYKNISNSYFDSSILNYCEYDSDIIENSRDSLGRIISKTINNNFNSEYEYVHNGDRTSLFINRIINNGDEYFYKYDKLLNIKHIYHNNNLEVTYHYDEYNQLVRDDNYKTHKTTRYLYDNNGNMITKKIYELNTFNLLNKDQFEYNDSLWCDKLTKFNDLIINYDEIGNIISIGNDIVMTWQNGKELKTYCDNNNTISYDYNSNGIRLSKNINGNVTKYFLEGSKIIFEKNNDYYLYFLYDSDNKAIGFEYNNYKYYYIKNVLNDVIGIVDGDNNIIAKYEYDSYGNILSITDGNEIDVSDNSSHVANINPFRYRSYYYDKETDYYYLNKRYYNPRWGRFINADGYLALSDSYLSVNLFIFALNNPITYFDQDGMLFDKIIKGLKSFCSAAWKMVTSAFNTVASVISSVVSVRSRNTTKYETTICSEGNNSLKFGGYTKYVPIKREKYVSIYHDLGTNTSGVEVGNFIKYGISANAVHKEISFNIGTEHSNVELGFSLENGSVFMAADADVHYIKELGSEIGLSARTDVDVWTVVSVAAFAFGGVAIKAVDGVAFGAKKAISIIPKLIYA